MAVHTEIVAYREIGLPQGTVRYREAGSGPTLVFVHGLLANSTLWLDVMAHLSRQFRCIAPDLPLGGHSIPLHPAADRTPAGVADLLAALLAALDLRDVTLVGNDTGGAICQITLARHPERIAGLVLTNCDAFESFFPALVSPFHYGPRLFGDGFTNTLAWILRSRSAQRIFWAALAHRRVDDATLDAYFSSLLHNLDVRRDATRFMRTVSNRYTLDAARTFGSFRHPVLIVWGQDDIFFSNDLARRLQRAFPDATLEMLPNSRAFVPADRPEALADHIIQFIHARQMQQTT